MGLRPPLGTDGVLLPFGPERDKLTLPVLGRIGGGLILGPRLPVFENAAFASKFSTLVNLGVDCACLPFIPASPTTGGGRAIPGNASVPTEPLRPGFGPSQFPGNTRCVSGSFAMCPGYMEGVTLVRFAARLAVFRCFDSGFLDWSVRAAADTIPRGEKEG